VVDIPWLRNVAAAYRFSLWRFAVKDRTNKLLFAFLQIVAALPTEWYQTGKFAAQMTRSQSVDRWTFIIAGILVIGNGLEKVFTESEAYIPADPPQPDKPPIAPTTTP
jgi:hypothetical protein